jgi:hypothetical protein
VTGVPGRGSPRKGPGGPKEGALTVPPLEVELLEDVRVKQLAHLLVNLIKPNRLIRINLSPIRAN